MDKYRYVYGAAVHGIQSFIFNTNELRDIVGASELVENICTTMFEERFLQGGESLVNAAGNIKCIYSSEEECRTAVLSFPKAVMEAAPGITISQAVVKATERRIEDNFNDVIDELEGRLRVQRNRPCDVMVCGFMGAERSRKTGLPAVVCADGEYIDEGTQKKSELSRGGAVTMRLCEKSFGIVRADIRRVAMNIGDLADSNGWLAVVHIDGNEVGRKFATSGGSKERLVELSRGISKAAVEASHAAFNAVCKSDVGKYPLRPIVLGGDDVTVICRASVALDYVKAYLEAFEGETRKRLGEAITACAGIAYIKSSYPFHYGYELSMSLCDHAKNVSKQSGLRDKAGNVPSSMMFYKVQSSFVENYARLVEKERQPLEGHSFNFGPYFLRPAETFWTIDDLVGLARSLQRDGGSVVKSGIRKWMSVMWQSAELARQMAERCSSLLSKPQQDMFHDAVHGVCRRGSEELFYPASDIIDMYTMLK